LARIFDGDASEHTAAIGIRAASNEEQGAMVTKRKPERASKPENKRSAVTIELRDESDDLDAATARNLSRPEVQAAAAIQKMEGDNYEVNALIRELSEQVQAVQRGDLSRAEAMMIAQAHTLDELFCNLARRSYANIVAGHGDAGERYMRLALKAQSQCRTTLEGLAEMKNPRPVAFVNQANIANGPQQVNNGSFPPCTRPRAGENPNLQNKLLEEKDGERLDPGTACTPGRADPAMATVEAKHRPTNTRG